MKLPNQNISKNCSTTKLYEKIKQVLTNKGQITIPPPPTTPPPRLPYERRLIQHVKRNETTIREQILNVVRVLIVGEIKKEYVVINIPIKKLKSKYKSKQYQ